MVLEDIERPRYLEVRCVQRHDLIWDRVRLSAAFELGGVHVVTDREKLPVTVAERKIQHGDRPRFCRGLRLRYRGRYQCHDGDDDERSDS